MMTRYPLASLKRRFVAAFIDGVITSLPYTTIIGMLTIFLASGMDYDPDTGKKIFHYDYKTTLVMQLLQYSFMALSIIFLAGLEATTGRTPGKWLLGIQVLPAQGKKLSFWRAILRNLTKALLFILSIIGVLLNNKKQTIHDILGQTYVVRTK